MTTADSGKVGCQPALFLCATPPSCTTPTEGIKARHARQLSLHQPMAHVDGEYSVQRGAFGAEAPLTEERLVSLVEQAFEGNGQLGECVEDAVTRLAAASSQHKFVVTATEIRGAGAAGQTLQSHAGAAWDGKRDGAHSVRVQRAGSEVLVTVVWLAR